jgi:hypothetical protein
VALQRTSSNQVVTAETGDGSCDVAGHGILGAAFDRNQTGGEPRMTRMNADIEVQIALLFYPRVSALSAVLPLIP